MSYDDPTGHCFRDACILEGSAAVWAFGLLLTAVGAGATAAVVADQYDYHLWGTSPPKKAPVANPPKVYTKPYVIQGGKGQQNNKKEEKKIPPVPQPKPKEKEKKRKKVILYHYTTAQGLEGILSSKRLYPSLKALNPNDARYGDGQYFTDIVPNTKTPAELSRALVGVPWQGYRFTHYLAIDVTDLPIIMGRKNVYVHHSTVPIYVGNRIVKSGKVTKTK